MKYTIHHFRLFFLLSCLISTSCSKTTFIGPADTAISATDKSAIVYYDYSDLSEMTDNTEMGDFRYFHGDLADFDLQYCSMKNRNDITPECISRSASAHQAEIVIVSWLNTCKEGDKFQSAMRDSDGNLPSTAESQHVGEVEFAVFNASLKTELFSFRVRTKNNAVGIEDRNSDVSMVNLSSCKNAARKARRKGLKKLMKNIANY